MRREEGPGESYGPLRNPRLPEQPGSGAPQGHIFRKRLQSMGSSPTWKFKTTETYTVRCAPQERCWGHLQCSLGQWKGSWACGLGRSRAAVREKGAGRRGRGQKKVQVCLSSEGRADGICVLRSGGLEDEQTLGTSGAVPAVISQPHGPLGPGVFCLVYGGRDFRQSWGRNLAGRSSALPGERHPWCLRGQMGGLGTGMRAG